MCNQTAYVPGLPAFQRRWPASFQVVISGSSRSLAFAKPPPPPSCVEPEGQTGAACQAHGQKMQRSGLHFFTEIVRLIWRGAFAIER
jgi:hypothetical protein